MRQNTVHPLNLDQDIKSGKIAPIYLISGEETYLVGQTVKQLVDHLLEPTTRDFNFDVFDGTQADLREILSAVEVYPTMADRRVVLVNEPTSFMDAFTLIKACVLELKFKEFCVITNMVNSEHQGKLVFKKFNDIVTKFYDVNLNHVGSLLNIKEIRDSVLKKQPIVLNKKIKV